MEIPCPADCIHLATAKAHPSATSRRQHDADVRALMAGAGRLSEGQLQLFFLIHSYFLRPVPPGTPRPIDAEVSDAAGALAGTFETASRGVIFEHQAGSIGGRRMAGELLGVLQEAGKGGGSRFEREVAEVLRAIERSATPPPDAPADTRRYLELAARVLRENALEAPTPPSPLILP